MKRKRPPNSSSTHVIEIPDVGLEDVYGSTRPAVLLTRRPLNAVGEDTRTVLDGPDSLRSLFSFEQWMMTRMFHPSVEGAAARKWRFERNVEAGVVLHTDHSGLGTAEIALTRIIREANDQGYAHGASVKCHRACDIKMAAQKMLINSGEDGPEHVHSNILDSLKPELRIRLIAMEPPPGRTHTRKLTAHKAIHQVMMQAFKDGTMFNSQASAFCLKHRQLCPGFLCPKDKCSMVVSGTACTAWSKLGKTFDGSKQEGVRRTNHQSVLPWFVFVFYVLTFQPELAIHEITEFHPEEIMQFHFGTDYEIISLHVSPWTLGFPSARPRRYRVLANRKKGIFVGTPDDFFALLECKPAVAASDLCCASDEMVMQAFLKAAKFRKKIPGEGVPSAWEDVLTPAQKARVDAQRAACVGTYLDGDFMVDISASEGFGLPAKWTPTLVQNSEIWVECRKRIALPLEHFVFQGFPLLPGVSTLATEVPWKPQLEDLTDAEMKSLAGNAMHLGVVGAVQLFALCSYQRNVEEDTDVIVLS